MSCTTTAASVPVTEPAAGVSYVQHSYIVTIRSSDEFEPHIQRLQEYVQSCLRDKHAETRNDIEFEMGMVADEINAYSATFPEMILRWLQSRPEVETIERNTLQYLC
ncbi:hypothetical protein K438DRAFT_1955899 [Mycena galopus ATCC 62051]|nr:hypothetical protein K438DRAFT_1955899 [Mycena galopus ATCC 62051]